MNQPQITPVRTLVDPKHLPGVGEEISRIGAQITNIQRSLMMSIDEQTQQLAKEVHTQVQSERLLAPEGMVLTRMFPSIRPNREQVAQAKQQISVIQEQAAEQIRVLTWRHSALQALVIGGSALTIEEIMRRFTDAEPNFAPSKEDVQFISEWIATSQQAIGLGDQSIETVREQRRHLVSQLSQRKSVSSYGIISAAGDHLLSIMGELSRPQLPDDTTVGDILAALTESGTSPEVVAAFKTELDEPLTDIVNRWATVNARIDMLKSRVSEMDIEEMEDIIRSGVFKNMWTTQALLLMMPYELYREHFLISFIGMSLVESARAGNSYLSMYGLDREDNGFLKRFEAAPSGLSRWQSYAYAFNEWDTNGFLKFSIEVLGDPLTYFGIGLYGKALKPIPLLGKGVAGFERGYQAAIDIPFRALKETLFDIAPKSVNQRAVAASIKGLSTLKAAVEIVYDRSFRRITPDEFQVAALGAIRHVRQTPDAQGPLADLGRYFLRRAPLTSSKLSGLADSVGVELSATSISEGAVGDIQQFLNLARINGGGMFSVDEVADLIMKKLNILDDITGNNRRAVIDFIQRDAHLAEDAIENVFSRAKTTRNAAVRFQNFVNNQVVEEAASLATKDRTQIATLAGRVSQLPAPIVAVWQNYIERWITVPFARMYLLFALYTPWNVAEIAFKTIAIGENPFYRGNPLRRLQTVTIGLDDVDPIFIKETGISPQLGDIFSRRNLSAAKEQEISVKGWRKAWASFSDSARIDLLGALENLPIIGSRRGAGITTRQMAHHLERLFNREMWKREPEMMQATIDIAQGLSGGMAEHLSSRELDTILKHAHELAIHNPRGLVNILDNVSDKDFYSRDIVEMVSQYPELPIGLDDILLEELDKGTMWTGLDDVFKNDFSEMIWQESFNSGELIQRQIGDIIQSFMDEPVTSVEGLKIRAQALHMMSEDFQSYISAQVRAGQRYAIDITNLAKKNAFYDELYNKRVLPFMENIEVQLNRFVQNLRETVQNQRLALDLTDVQMADYETLFDLHLGHVRLIRQARLQQRELEERLLAERKTLRASITARGEKPSTDHPEIQAWWEQFKNERDVVWNKFTEQQANIVSEFLEMGASIEAVGLPTPRRVAGPLTPNDISYLFGTQSTDLSSALWMPQVMSLRSRESFVARVYSRANRIARQTDSTADDLGYSKDAIGNVHDFLLQQMKIDPSTVSLLEPRFLQLEALRKELWHYAHRRKLVFSEDAQLAVRQFARNYESALRGDSRTSGKLYGELSKIEPSTVLPLGERSTIVSDASGKPIQVYHGSSRAFEKFDPSASNPDALFGPGIYFTEDPGIAGGYARPTNGRIVPRGYVAPTPAPNVRPAFLKFKKVFDIDAPIDEDVLNDIISSSRGVQFMEDNLEEALDFVNRKADLSPKPLLPEISTIEQLRGRTNEDLYNLLNGLYKSRSEVNDSLSSRGFDSITHIGGARTGNEPHRVWIAIGDDLGEVEDSIVSSLTAEGRAFGGEPAVPSRAMSEEWRMARQSAYDDVNAQFKLNFPDYQNGTAFNAFMKSIFPFWTYEAHRLFYLPRQALRTPGAYMGWGKYMDNTDNGYIHIPGTSLEINPLRGTILMGGLRGMFYRDFPEFYDRFGGAANVLDQANRFGFYPNVLIQGALSLAGAKTGQSQTGEMLFPLVQAPIEALVAAFPESRAAKALVELLLPGRYRDMQVAVNVSKRGHSGPELLNKKYANIPFTSDEQKIWDSAQRFPGLFNMFNSQIALFRFRPEELNVFREHVGLLYEEHLGITVSEQKRIREAGLRITDIVPIPPHLKELINDLDGAAQWRGLTTHLRESAVGQEMALVRTFWDDVDNERQRKTVRQEEYDLQWRQGLISMSVWEKKTRENNQTTHTFTETLKHTAIYQGVPITFEERQIWSENQGLDPVILHPLEELQNIYYDFTIEDKFNPKTGRIEPNYDEFFAYQKAVESSVPEPYISDFREWARRRDTPMQRARRADYEQFIRPYLDAFDFVLSTFEDSEQEVILHALNTDDPIERQQLREQETVGGRNIVGLFESQLSEFRENLRKLDPELDARLLLWRPWAFKSAKTSHATDIYNNLIRRYGRS